MPMTSTPIFAQTPFVGFADLSAVTAVTTRAPTADATLVAATTQYKLLAAASTNGLRIDEIEVQASSSVVSAPTAAQIVYIWLSNATTAYLIDEIVVSALTPSAQAPAFSNRRSYTNFVIPSTYKLWASTTVTTTASTTAITVIASGGAY